MEIFDEKEQEKYLKEIDIKILGIHPKHCRDDEQYHLVVVGLGNRNGQKQDPILLRISRGLVDKLREEGENATEFLARNLRRIDRFLLPYSEIPN